MKLFTTVASLLLIAGFALAEDRPPLKVVRVVGTSEVKVVPDRAVIELGVEQQNTSASLAKQAEDAIARKILTSLRANGIDEKDVQTTYLSLRPHSNFRKGLRISYFVAEQTMSVTVRDISRLDALLEALIKAGGNRIDSIQYESSDLRKYRDQARELAVKAAREKAQALAQALGQEIGKAQYIEEIPQSAYQYSNTILANSYSESVTASRSGSAMAVGQQTISASIVVSFDLN